LAKGFSILFIFSKNQLFVLFILCVLLIILSLIYALIFVISFCLLIVGLTYSAFSKSLGYLFEISSWFFNIGTCNCKCSS
jgi:hypothetical protein